mgnify:CR=1 FL=1
MDRTIRQAQPPALHQEPRVVAADPLVAEALREARRLGADGAFVSASSSQGLDVTVRLGGAAILQRVSLDVAPGEAVALIEEIKKGARGGDCIQVINTRSATNCGKIYYESKRTKAFQPAWIEKFKADVREKGANIGVLVTEAMPADMPQMGQRDGVWVCTFADLPSLSAVLRDSLITIHRVLAGQENRGDKMSLVYDFVTSDEFRMQVDAIVEGFTQMQTDLETEKRAMARIWKQREKQIEKVLLNTSNMYGAIKGIAGNAIPAVRRLELPGSEEDDEATAERPDDADD